MATEWNGIIRMNGVAGKVVTLQKELCHHGVGFKVSFAYDVLCVVDSTLLLPAY